MSSGRKRNRATIQSLTPLLLAACAGYLDGQEVKVYSELQRVDPFGEVVAADRGAAPREILSPAAPRNGFLSFHVAVTVPTGENYFLYIVTNPLNACRVALYKEHFSKTAAGWIPDALEPVVRLPHFGAMPDPVDNVPGQTTRVYLLDLWIPPEAKPPGFRLEVQLKTGDWTVWPMEVRVLPITVALQPGTESRPLPALGEPADRAAAAPLEDFFTGVFESREVDVDTVRSVIRRNAIQDMELASGLDREAVRQTWQKPRTPGAEWYLRVRDWIYRTLQAR